MPSKLEQLLESIDPERTLDEVASRADRAIDSFRVDSGGTRSHDEFKECMARFLCHVENALLRINPPRSFDLEFDWGRCTDILRQEYGPTGFMAAFEIASTGTEGGMYSILKAVARRLSEQYAGNEISARISRYWNDLSADAMIASSKEYLEKFGHLLPPELTEGGAARVRANLPKVLEQHPRLIRELKRVGR